MKINCGGFEIDENNFELDGRTLKLKNGGSGGGPLVVTLTSNFAVVTTDKTAGEIFDALPNVVFVNNWADNQTRTVFHISDYSQSRGLYYIGIFTGQNSNSTLKEASLFANSATAHMTNQQPQS